MEVVSEVKTETPAAEAKVSGVVWEIGVAGAVETVEEVGVTGVAGVVAAAEVSWSSPFAISF
jgi:hypothetical protein